MSGSSDTPRGWEAGGAGTGKPEAARPEAEKKKDSAAPPRRRKAARKGAATSQRKAPSANSPGTKRRPAKKKASPKALNRLKAGDSLLLGWELPDQRAPLGFREEEPTAADSDARPIWLRGEGHMITIAPTGAGKGRGALIPNLLTYEGPAIVIDPKGEACHITAQRRREMGQKVYIIDPFQMISEETDSLNPMDAFRIPGIDPSALALDIAKQLSGGNKIAKDPFWDIRGHDLAAGVIAAIAATREPADCNLITVRKLLKQDDSTYNMAVLLDTMGGKIPPFAYEEISNYLQTTEITRSGIHATACSYFSVIASAAAQRTVKTSTIDLDAVRRGDPITIYLVVPPSKLASHAPLYRLWTAALMSALLSRESDLPEHRTLLAIDECAQLGDFAMLAMVYTLARSYGMRVWAFFQDLAQIKRVLPEEWPTVLTNAAALQVFGVPNHLMASHLAELMGDFSDDTLRRLDRAHLALQVAGQPGLTARRPDYLTDPVFEGRYRPHPLLGGRSL